MTENNFKNIDFTEINEPWSGFLLSDGTKLKVKIVLVRVIKEGEDPQGNPVYGFLAQNVVGAISPIGMRGDLTLGGDDDVQFEVENLEWSEYTLSDGRIFRIRPNISQVTRAVQLDPKGFPMYGAVIQPSIKVTQRR